MFGHVNETETVEVARQINDYADICTKNNNIDASLYAKYDVKRGLRDLNGKGVLTGLTDISEIVSSKTIDGVSHPCEGKLYYRGIDVESLVEGFEKDKRFGFEEVAYLLLFGQLPSKSELEELNTLLSKYRTLPTSFVRDIIMKAPSLDMTNTLARSVLTLYSYDENANDVTIPNVMRQCLQLIALFPLLTVYAYQAYSHYHDGESLYIHMPNPKLSTAENILYMLRPDNTYSELEAHILDIALVLHAEHGGGNNSSFTAHVVSSTGTDTYSVMAASLGSLKGPRHGGANIKVVQMFNDMKQKVSDWTSESQITDYLVGLLEKREFDNAGLIYGMGHAVYSLSDPRATLFRRYVELLSQEKGRDEEYKLYTLVERLAPEIISDRRKIYKGVSANIDFYSGLVYSLMDLPMEIYTPIFAIARVVGWSAHILEELINGSKIIRPAFMSVSERKDYVPLEQR